MSIVETRAFVQKSRIGNAVFSIQEEALAISGNIGFRKVEESVGLDKLSPKYESIKLSLHRRLAIAASVCLFVVMLAIFTFKSPELRDYLKAPIICVEGLFIFALLRTALRSIYPIEVIRFNFKTGATAFEIVREREQASECDQFVNHLSALVTRHATYSQ